MRAPGVRGGQRAQETSSLPSRSCCSLRRGPEEGVEVRLRGRCGVEHDALASCASDRASRRAASTRRRRRRPCGRRGCAVDGARHVAGRGGPGDRRRARGRHRSEGRLAASVDREGANERDCTAHRAILPRRAPGSLRPGAPFGYGKARGLVRAPARRPPAAGLVRALRVGRVSRRDSFGVRPSGCRALRGGTSSLGAPGLAERPRRRDPGPGAL